MIESRIFGGARKISTMGKLHTQTVAWSYDMLKNASSDSCGLAQKKVEQLYSFKSLLG